MQKTSDVPSGKHTKNYGKSPFLMGKSTINGPFSIAMLVYQRVTGLRLHPGSCELNGSMVKKKPSFFSVSFTGCSPKE